jgi:hypothetical protein
LIGVFNDCTPSSHDPAKYREKCGQKTEDKQAGHGWLRRLRLRGSGLMPARANTSQDPVSKITTAKWTGGVAQVIKHLLCKHEVLSSNSSLTKKQKQKQNQKTRQKTEISLSHLSPKVLNFLKHPFRES